jgi:hypothetical protein
VLKHYIEFEDNYPRTPRTAQRLFRWDALPTADSNIIVFFHPSFVFLSFWAERAGGGVTTPSHE